MILKKTFSTLRILEFLGNVKNIFGVRANYYGTKFFTENILAIEMSKLKYLRINLLSL